MSDSNNKLGNTMAIVHCAMVMVADDPRKEAERIVRNCASAVGGDALRRVAEETVAARARKVN